MSIPTAVFVDTCVLRHYSYNFSHRILNAFVSECKHRQVKLLLPDPTEREIKRQMVELSLEAANLVEQARQTAPFLDKLRNFPRDDIPRSDISRVRDIEWELFLKQFNVVRLKYDGVSIEDVMNWYDAALAPFDTKKKRNEFPDAFAVAILSSYAARHECYVAVVSQDKDFERACKRFPALMHFCSLPFLTEVLLSEDSRIAVFRGVRDSQQFIDKLTEAVHDATREVTFHVTNQSSALTYMEVGDVVLADVRIVALGEHDFTVAFDAVVQVAHEVEWCEPTGPDGDMDARSETVIRDHELSGAAKVSTDAATDAFLDIPYLALNEKVIELEEMPPFVDRWR